MNLKENKLRSQNAISNKFLKKKKKKKMIVYKAGSFMGKVIDT